MTPLRRITGGNWLVRLRRIVGLFGFFYAFLHFMTFLWFDHFFDVAEMLKDVVKRPFITVSFAAFVLLLLSTLSTPIIQGIPLATFRGVRFGTFGYCNGTDCKGPMIGYDTGM